MASLSAFSVVDTLRNRLKETQEQRAALQANLRTLDEKLVLAFNRGIKRPQTKLESIAAQVQELEFKRSTTSLTLMQEKETLKRIEKIKAERGAHAEYQAHQDNIDALKEAKAATFVKLQLNQKATLELRDGIAKLELCKRISDLSGEDVSPVDLVTEQVNVPSAKLGSLIGRGGSSIRQLEKECVVACDVTRRGSNEAALVKVSGTASGVQSAVARIDEIVSAISKVHTLDAGLVRLLVGSRGSQLRALETEHRVRIDLPRSSGNGANSNKVTISGAPACVQQTIDALAAVKAGIVEVAITNGLVPAVLGTGGSRIAAIQKDTGASIALDRSALLVRVAGAPDAVSAAVAALEEVIEENRERVETVPLPLEDMAAYVIGKGGATVRRLQEESKASVNVRRSNSSGGGGRRRGKRGGRQQQQQEQKSAPADVAEGKQPAAGEGEGDGDGSAPPSGAWVQLRGKRAAVEAAKAALAALLERYHKENGSVACSTAVANSVLSREAGTLSKIRKDTGATIELDRGAGVVRVRGEEEAVAAGVAAVEAAIAGYAEEALTMPRGAIGSIIGKGGAAARKLQSDTGARLDVDRGRDSASVKISGTAEGVAAAVAAVTAILEAWQKENAEVTVPRGFTPRLIGKGGATIKQMRRDTGASIELQGNTTVAIRGAEEAVAAAVAAVDALLEEYGKENAEVAIPEDGGLTLLIGRGGSTLRQLQSDTGATLEILRKQNVVNIRGNTESVPAAVAAVNALFAVFHQHLEVMEVPAEGVGTLLGKGGGGLLPRLEKEHGVLIDIQRPTARGKGKGKGKGKGAAESITNTPVVMSPALVKIRGEEASVEVAKEAIVTHLRENMRVVDSLRVPESVLGEVIGRGGVNLQALQKDFAVQVNVARPKAALPSASGTNAAAGGRVFPSRTSRGRGRSNNSGSSNSAASSSSSSSSAASLAVITIRGVAAGVEGAKAALCGLVFGRAQVAAPLPFTESQLAELQGRGQLYLQRLNNSSAVSVQVDAEAGCVCFEGPEQSVQSTRLALERLMHRFCAREFVEVELAPAFIPSLVGPRGASIIALAEQSGASVNLCRATNSVLVSGSEDTVQAARALIDDALTAFQRTFCQVQLTAAQMPFIVGTRGATIRSLRTHGATVEVSNDRLLSIRGEEAAVAAARAALEELLRRFEVENVEMEIPLGAAPKVIGKGGATIKKLRQDTGASIELRGDTTLTIRGAEEVVTAAVAALEELLGPLLAEATEVELPWFAIPSIIGKRGATIRQLQDDTGASIEVDRVAEVARVRGDDDARDAAVDALYAIIEDAQWEEDRKAEGRNGGGGGGGGGGNWEYEEEEEETYEEQPKQRMPPAWPVGAGPPPVGLSKSARRRMRRKQRNEGGAAPPEGASAARAQGIADMLMAAPAADAAATGDAQSPLGLAPGTGIEAPPTPAEDIPPPPPGFSGGDEQGRNDALARLAALGFGVGVPAAASGEDSSYYHSQGGYSVRL